ncbi:Acid phosphatase [Tessaracoccus sp. O5.2]|uniref:histidine phosphatase family protein n=1 Tax=Tessaracoccus sp. O5.2 TaxID=3157622 RepID=UPI0035F0F98A
MAEDDRTQLWLVRHGATEWSRDGRHTSTTDLDLLPQGREDAEVIARRLEGEHFDLVLSSPRLRARETARLAGFTAPEIDPDLVEWDYGPGEGLTSVQIGELVPGWRIWTHGAPDLDRDGMAPGESRQQVEERLGRVVARAKASGLPRILVFGHGHALRALAMLWIEQPVPLAASFPFVTGALGILGWEKDSPALVRWNS